MKQCYFCKGAVRDARVRAIREYDGQVVVLDDVPALVCVQCGEQFFEGSVVEEMERLAHNTDGAHELRVPLLRFEKSFSGAGS